ncbi:MAG TPA: dethiobiotin synthase, partial [Polyangiaceae bacterium]|nr:dethiobiotin synthase [Polyangiaceae bacterium]
MAIRIVLVGTGTGVGKTHVGVAVLHAFAARGISAVGLKPIETGLPSDDRRDRGTPDCEELSRAGVSKGTFHVKPPRYGFADPVSPHLAAARSGERIDLGEVRRWVMSNSGEVTLVETAGGLFTPLGPGSTNLDIALALAPAHVLL